MNRQIPPDAFGRYLAMGADRSYQRLADALGVSKQAVVNRANEEDWRAKLRDAEHRISEAAAKRAEETRV